MHKIRAQIDKRKHLKCRDRKTKDHQIEQQENK